MLVWFLRGGPVFSAVVSVLSTSTCGVVRSGALGFTLSFGRLRAVRHSRVSEQAHRSSAPFGSVHQMVKKCALGGYECGGVSRPGVGSVSVRGVPGRCAGTLLTQDGGDAAA